MEIIPVIDLMGGRVVAAKAGLRDSYQSIESVLTDATDLITVVADLLSYFPFKTIYIADLDAIIGQKVDTDLYQNCLKLFPEVTFWLDAGVRNQVDWQLCQSLGRLEIVLGSESLQTLSLLSEYRSSILSLDFKQGQFLGDEAILSKPKFWPERVIVMNLDRVGNEQGPDCELIKTLLARKPNIQLIAAGGVRGGNDLMLLSAMGVERVLLASALHKGKVTREMLEHY